MAAAHALVLYALACTLAVATAQPGASPPFDSFGAAELLFRYDLPSDKQPDNGVIGNTAAALPPANIVTRVFALEPCSLFAPHFHPGSSEFFIGLDGEIEIFALVGSKLVTGTIDEATNFLVPKNVLHTFYNDKCEQANVQTVLTNGPGFQGYYDIPKKFLKKDITLEGLQGLAASGKANATLDVPRAFFELTDKCKKRCRKDDHKRQPKRKCIRRSFYGICIKYSG